MQAWLGPQLSRTSAHITRGWALRSSLMQSAGKDWHLYTQSSNIFIKREKFRDPQHRFVLHLLSMKWFSLRSSTGNGNNTVTSHPNVLRAGSLNKSKTNHITRCTCFASAECAVCNVVNHLWNWAISPIFKGRFHLHGTNLDGLFISLIQSGTS
jgi:hypothetical protein